MDGSGWVGGVRSGWPGFISQQRPDYPMMARARLQTELTGLGEMSNMGKSCFRHDAPQ